MQRKTHFARYRAARRLVADRKAKPFDGDIASLEIRGDCDLIIIHHRGDDELVDFRYAARDLISPNWRFPARSQLPMAANTKAPPPHITLRRSAAANCVSLAIYLRTPLSARGAIRQRRSGSLPDHLPVEVKAAIHVAVERVRCAVAVGVSLFAFRNLAGAPKTQCVKLPTIPRAACLC